MSVLTPDQHLLLLYLAAAEAGVVRRTSVRHATALDSIRDPAGVANQLHAMGYINADLTQWSTTEAGRARLRLG